MWDWLTDTTPFIAPQGPGMTPALRAAMHGGGIALAVTALSVMVGYFFHAWRYHNTGQLPGDVRITTALSGFFLFALAACESVASFLPDWPVYRLIVALRMCAAVAGLALSVYLFFPRVVNGS